MDTNPAAETAATEQPQPVEPGARAARLQQLYTASLKRTLKKLSQDTFAECYPTIAKKAPAVLTQVQSQMVDKLSQKCEKEFDNILESRQVIEKLNSLEDLVSDAQKRHQTSSSSSQPTPPHTLPPKDILAAHLGPTLTARTSSLTTSLQSTQSQNRELADQVRCQREEIDMLLAKLEGAVDDVKTANEALGSVTSDLATESRATNAQLAEHQ